MAQVVGILGQFNPVPTTLTNMYTVPSSKHVTGRIIITNIGGTATTFRIAFSPNGDAIADEHYVAYNTAIDVGATGSTIGILLGDLDIVRVWAGNGSVSFTLMGLEQDD